MTRMRTFRCRDDGLLTEEMTYVGVLVDAPPPGIRRFCRKCRGVVAETNETEHMTIGGGEGRATAGIDEDEEDEATAFKDPGGLPWPLGRDG